MSSSEDRRPAGHGQDTSANDLRANDLRANDLRANDLRANDEYGWIDRYAADLHRSAKELVEKGEAARVSDEALAQIITAAVRLYYAKSELEDRPVPAIVQEGPETLTATEMLVAVSEMLRDVHLGPMELGLWFRRRPGENLPAHEQPDGNDTNHSMNVARSRT